MSDAKAVVAFGKLVLKGMDECRKGEQMLSDCGLEGDATASYTISLHGEDWEISVGRPEADGDD